ncbi:hypothetical protein [Pseudomonas sp. Marseille-Q1929]|uniref:hypothetical protein n=1 Tax=Pseudomonas sp. Marseille-Q1929 TaxID=2730402 RepID=UPI001A8F4A63|nr:hypothetical protein [Pseudomonas sp. Marseille-Q1929]MBO0494766.1 hypothetical protein [Pseudomonas sp. Marseille-Q1929]
MSVFIFAPGVNQPGAVLPDASIIPVNNDGTINESDIVAKAAYIHISPYVGIELGDRVTCLQEILGGTWIDFLDVIDPQDTLKVLVRPVNRNGGSYTKISYSVQRVDGGDVGHSGQRHYDVV